MLDMTVREMMEELREFDTPSITNVLATYPGAETCLTLYDPWAMNWYTDNTLQCWYPELGALVGFAVTAIYGLPDPSFPGRSFMDVIDVMGDTDEPCIFLFEQQFPPEIAGKVGLSGGNMTSAMKAVGCVGAISNGPSRDKDEIREMGFQYMTNGVTPGHGSMQIKAIQVPVSIAGMDVAPGDIIHMDENGAVRFPANLLEKVLVNVRALRDNEAERMGNLHKVSTAQEVRDIFAGKGYAKK